MMQSSSTPNQVKLPQSARASANFRRNDRGGEPNCPAQLLCERVGRSPLNLQLSSNLSQTSSSQTLEAWVAPDAWAFFCQPKPYPKKTLKDSTRFTARITRPINRAGSFLIAIARISLEDSLECLAIVCHESSRRENQQRQLYNSTQHVDIILPACLILTSCTTTTLAASAPARLLALNSRDQQTATIVDPHARPLCVASLSFSKVLSFSASTLCEKTHTNIVASGFGIEHDARQNCASNADAALSAFLERKAD
ncbi:hypothetical protein BDZ45DRAFT_741449 [Acephala macrosclerotiorum]|nr:hypothetical protein BDZ45DRAFT_741449 [Acephala macrosclerotiorum]